MDILETGVFEHSGIKHLNLPSVTEIRSKAFVGSRLRTLIVENAEIIDEQAFIGLNWKVKV